MFPWDRAFKTGLSSVNFGENTRDFSPGSAAIRGEVSTDVFIILIVAVCALRKLFNRAGDIRVAFWVV